MTISFRPILYWRILITAFGILGLAVSSACAARPAPTEAAATERLSTATAASREAGIYEQEGRQREAWIEDLEAGRNPFDAAMLDALRGS